MTPEEAKQLRRAINRLYNARADCNYAKTNEPHNVHATEEHHDRCARRLHKLIDGLTDKPGKGA